MKQQALEAKTQGTQSEHISCNAMYTGCLLRIPAKEARIIEGVGLSCGNCYEKDLHTHD
jgi:hypothetical protein